MKPCRIMHCCSVKNPLNFGVIPAHCSQLPALLDLWYYTNCVWLLDLTEGGMHCNEVFPVHFCDLCWRSRSHSLISVTVVIKTRFPFSSTRQHPSYGDCLEVKREYYQNSSVLDCVTQCSQSVAHIWAVLTGQTDWVCHIGSLTLCIEAVAWSCIIVTWWSGSREIQTWSRWPTGFLQCFDTGVQYSGSCRPYLQ